MQDTFKNSYLTLIFGEILILNFYWLCSSIKSTISPFKYCEVEVIITTKWKYSTKIVLKNLNKCTCIIPLNMLLRANGLKKQEIWRFNFALKLIKNPIILSLKPKILVLRHDFWLMALRKEIWPDRNTHSCSLSVFHILQYSFILLDLTVCPEENLTEASDPNAPVSELSCSVLSLNMSQMYHP